jgi:hypothetical protein
MFRKLGGIIGTTVLFLMISISSFAFDSEVDHAKFESLFPTHKTCSTFVQIKTYGTAEGMYQNYELPGSPWMKAEGTYELKGSGTVVAPGFIYTAEHVVNPSSVSITTSPYSTWITQPTKITSRLISIEGCVGSTIVGWVYQEDEESDVALVRYVPRGILEPLQVEPMMWRDLVFEDNVVAAVLHERYDDGSMSSRTEIKWGTVRSKIVDVMDETVAPWFSLHDITVNLPIQGGDSGSLLFVFQLGKPYYVGILRAIECEHVGIFGMCGGEKRTFAAWIPMTFHRLLLWANPKKQR